MSRLHRVVGVAVIVLASVRILAAADWPQFHGPNRDDMSTETGLLRQWPEGGPKLLWKMTGLGHGYSNIAIVGERLYTMGDRPDGQPDRQCVLAFDLATHAKLWTTPIGQPHEDGAHGGPRSTPTVDGELLYVIGTEGQLVCLETATGKLRWEKSLVKEFGGRMMSMWKYSESPLVDGEKVVCTPGGPEATMVALDKKTGGLIWKCSVPKLGDEGKDGAGYSSIVVAEIAGRRQSVQFAGLGVFGVDPQSGKFLWGYSHAANKVANITEPLVHGDYVFATSCYKTGSGLVKITRDGENFKATEVWFEGMKDFSNHHGGVVLIGDYLYGGNGQNNGALTCLEFKTGKIVWKQKKGLGKGSAAILYADGRIYVRYEGGPVCLVETTPDGFKLDGLFTPPVVHDPCWPHPVVLDGRLYLRDQDTLMCYDVRK
jgi:outer membrane protein assembly factor BamB